MPIVVRRMTQERRIVVVTTIRNGDCVKIPDGRIARVREKSRGRYKVRVRRPTSATHQFLWFPANALEPVACPTGWMSPTGYNRYLKITLAKMRQRMERKPRSRAEKR
jgi:hypothetical protein